MNQEDIKRQLTTVYSRVVGWLTPVKNWNQGKLAEWKDRVTYKNGNDDTKIGE